MAISIKRQIVSQLRRIGLHFEPSTLRVLAPSHAQDIAGQSGIGRTFGIDVPTEANSSFFNKAYSDKIEESLLKNLRSNSSLIEKVQTHSATSEGDANGILFQVNFDCLVKELFTDLRQNLNKLFVSHRQDKTEHGCENYRKTIVVEYSSPNIAKPFHVGNLRSAIIGNCVANVLQFMGHKVVRMNYLGDWGTQFGILSLAFDHFGNEQMLESDPLKHLFDVYVKGNQEIEKNSHWREAAKERFTQLESKKDMDTFEQWTRFRDLSLQELKRLYQRLGIEFDVYTSESMYCDSSFKIIDDLKSEHLIEQSDDNALLAVVSSYNNSNQTIRVPLLKGDGSTLYLTRDIAAALDRKKQYDFDRMYYVVDSSQSKHFTSLKSILSSMGNPIYKDMKHLKFGRIIGMSTRRGDAIFLDDVLNEAKERALEAIKTSPNTKITADKYDQVADILGVSAIIVHDLANKRVKEYRFNWNKALKLTGDTGISLQYTHARLCNLERNCGIEMNPDCDINIAAIDTKEGRVLINLLAMFDQIVDRSYEELEPSVLANYLFDLRSAINRANQELTIKGQNEDVGQTRLLLFRCAHNVLNQCMQLLGLRPLDSM